MFKTIILAFLLTTTTSVFAADFPRPPIRPFIINETTLVTLDSYATVTSGSTFKHSYSFGANFGTKIYGPIFGEISYDYINQKHKIDNRVVGNVVLMQPLTYGTVYALAGAGYSTHSDKLVWNIGAGYRLPVRNNVDLDIRYRYVSLFDNRKLNDSQLTAGVVYKF